MSYAAELIWNWAGLYGDQLVMAVEDFAGTYENGTQRSDEDMSRMVAVLNLADTNSSNDLGSGTLVRCGIAFQIFS